MLKRPDYYRPILAALAVMLLSACASSTDNASPSTAPTSVSVPPDARPLLRQGRHSASCSSKSPTYEFQPHPTAPSAMPYASCPSRFYWGLPLT